MQEGVIKYECRFQQAPPPPAPLIQGLIDCRNALFAQNLIGVDPDGTGFGNISERLHNLRQFCISASQTGAVEIALPEHFVLVTDYDLQANLVVCRGTRQASSETLTHAMIYQAFPGAAAVIHVHHHRAWRRLKGHLPTTADDADYGTLSMCLEVKRLADDGIFSDKGTFVMGGHHGGLISFAGDLPTAHQLISNAVSSAC